MTRKVHYLSGRKPYSNGDRLQARYEEVHGDHRPYLERNGPRLIALCIVGLVTLGAAAWGWPVFVDWLIGEVGVEVD